MHFFLIKRKNSGLNAKRLHKNFLGIISLSRNLCQNSCIIRRVRVGLVKVVRA
jgi:hypothetical protein